MKFSSCQSQSNQASEILPTENMMTLFNQIYNFQLLLTLMKGGGKFHFKYTWHQPQKTAVILWCSYVTMLTTLTAVLSSERLFYFLAVYSRKLQAVLKLMDLCILSFPFKIIFLICMLQQMLHLIVWKTCLLTLLKDHFFQCRSLRQTLFREQKCTFWFTVAGLLLQGIIA